MVTSRIKTAAYQGFQSFQKEIEEPLLNGIKNLRLNCDI